MDVRRFVQIGDLHLYAGERNADRQAALDYVIAREYQHPIAAWLFPGDLTHAGLTIATRNFLASSIQTCADHAPVVVVPGNHDPEGDLAFLAKLRARYPVHVVTSPRVIAIPALTPGNLPQAAIFCVPYPNKAALVASGTHGSERHATVEGLYETIFMEAGAVLERCRKDGHITMTIGHATITGSMSSTGQPQIGAELSIDLTTHLSRLGPGFKGFNHIHRHQALAPDVWYAGSLCRMDWGETDPKGYLAITYHRETSADLWAFDVAFEPVPVPGMYHVDGTITRNGFETESDIDPSGADVRVRAHYLPAERGTLAEARAAILIRFAAARRVEIEMIADTTRAVRAPEVIDAQTLPDKLLAWGRVTGVTWTPELQRVVDQLLNAAPVDVLAELDQRLSAIQPNAKEQPV